MSLEEGDPRWFDPEIFGRLTGLEKVYVIRCYEMRLSQAGRGKPRYPDDESPASVARQAVIYGFVLLGQGTFSLAICLTIFAAVATIWWDWASGYEINFALCALLAVLVATVPWSMRAWQFNRYFVERYPESLDRWFFNPGFDRGATDQIEHSRAMALSDIVPALVDRLRRFERPLVARHFSRRLSGVAPDHFQRPEGESVIGEEGRVAVRRGVRQANWRWALPLVVLFGYATVAFAIGRSTGAAATSGACFLLLIVAATLIERRVRKVDQWFRDETQPSGASRD